jgi:LmbE family N-acetylglucosaminyl deacetylase
MPSPSRLFIFAHPDDDVFISSAMRRAIESGEPMHAAWLTSGDARGRGEVRERELAQAMALLGLPASRLHLLRFPNRGLLPVLGEVVAAMAALLDRLDAGAVFTTAYEGGHIDHDVLNFAVAEADKRSGQGRVLYEFPLYNRTGAFYTLNWRINDFPPSGEPAMRTDMTPELVRLKHSMMRAYTSQKQDMTLFRLCLTQRRLLRLGEPYRIFSSQRDYASRPHPGALNYERDRHARFEEFCEAVRQAQAVTLPGEGAAVRERT